MASEPVEKIGEEKPEKDKLFLWGQNFLLRFFTLSIFFIFLASLLGFILYLEFASADPTEIYIFSHERFFPSKPAYVMVLARNAERYEFLQNQKIDITVKNKSSGAVVNTQSVNTDKNGTAIVKIDALKDSEYIVKASIGNLSAVTEICRGTTEKKIFLSFDKAVYKPGETVHARISSLDDSRLKTEKIKIEIYNTDKNKIFTGNTVLSEFGNAGIDFKLEDKAVPGRYTISANGCTKFFDVAEIPDDKLTVLIETDQKFYYLGNTIKGKVRVLKYNGLNPLKDAEVVVYFSAGESTDNESKDRGLFGFGFMPSKKPKADKINGHVRGKTDSAGYFEFQVKLPEQFKNPKLDANEDADINFTFLISGKEKLETSYPITMNPMKINLFPRSEKFLSGIANQAFLEVTYSSGVPANVTLQVNGSPINTFADGLALIDLPASSNNNTEKIKVYAQDSDGFHLGKELYINSENGQFFNFQTDKAVYKSGENIEIKALFSSVPESRIYIELVKDNRIVFTEPLDVKDRSAIMTCKIPEDLNGTVQLNAYIFQRNGEIKRRSALLQIFPSGGLNVAASFDRDSYRPGDIAKVSLKVTDENGNPIQSSLNISVPDEQSYLFMGLNNIFPVASSLVQQEFFMPDKQVGCVDLLFDKKDKADAEYQLVTEYFFKRCDYKVQTLRTSSSTPFSERQGAVVKNKRVAGNLLFCILMFFLLFALIYFFCIHSVRSEAKYSNPLLSDSEFICRKLAGLNLLLLGINIFNIMLIIFTSMKFKDDTVCVVLISSLIFNILLIIAAKRILAAVSGRAKEFSSSSKVFLIPHILTLNLFGIIVFYGGAYFFPNTPLRLFLSLMFYSLYLLLSFVCVVCNLNNTTRVKADVEILEVNMGAGIGRRKKHLAVFVSIAFVLLGSPLLFYAVACVFIFPLVPVIETCGGYGTYYYHGGGGYREFPWLLSSNLPEYFRESPFKDNVFCLLQKPPVLNKATPLPERNFHPPMYWKAEILTDEKGEASVSFEVSGEACMYRFCADAADRSGRMGFLVKDLKVDSAKHLNRGTK